MMNNLEASIEAATMASKQSGSTRGPTAIALVVALLVVCTFTVFAQVATFDFLMWDDEPFLLPHLKRFGGLTPQSIQWALTNRENGWRTPVPYLSLFLDAELFGANPAGFHLSNLLIHTATVLMLFESLRRLTGQTLPSGLAAILFAIHPLHVEPVAWVSGRWDLLCGFFWVLGMWAYAAYCRRSTPARYACVTAAFVFAMGSKPMAMTFPCALLLLDFWPLQRLFSGPGVTDSPGNRFAHLGHSLNWRVILEKLPWLAIACVGAWLAAAAKQQEVAEWGIASFTWGQRVGNGLQTYLAFTADFFCPRGLTFFYVHPAVFGERLAAETIFAGLAVGAITLSAVLLVKRCPYVLVGWLWFLGVLVPASGLFQVGLHARADRYAYLPLIGLCLTVSWLIADAFRRYPRLGGVFSAAVLVALCSLMGLSVQQTHHWRDSRSLFTYALTVDGRNYKALLNMGVLASRNAAYGEAERWFRKAVAVIPGSGFAHYHLGRTLSIQGKTQEAKAELEQALRIDPSLRTARRLVAIQLEAGGDVAGALREYQEIVRRSPERTDGHLWLGKFLARSKDFERSVEEFRHVLELNPDHSEALHLLGTALINLRQVGQAWRVYDEFLVRNPHRVDVANEYAWMLATHPAAEVRNGPRALEVVQRLCRQSNAQNRHLLDTLAAAYAEVGQFDSAERAAEIALQLARDENDVQHVHTLSSRLAEYRRKVPYRQPAVQPASQPKEATTEENQP